MFRPIHLLPKPINPDLDKVSEYKERWEKGHGKKCYDFVINKIKKGGGEDFLQRDYQQGQDLKHIMKDEWDLKGIKIWQLDIDFPRGDNFEGIDFSFAEFWHSKFNHATFPNTYFEFSKFYNFEFNQCLFAFSNWYGVTFEKVKFIECDFVEYDSFNNCRFIECEFIDCFFSKNPFIDCSFDVQTTFSKIKQQPSSNFNVTIKDESLPELYKGIKDGYLAGEVFEQYRKYLFFQKHSETKYLKRGFTKIHGYINEMIAGYGIKPQNTLLIALLVILSFWLLLALQSVSVGSALKMSIGAFVGFGNVPDDIGFSLLLLIESVIGISLIALFIIVLANIWFSEK